MLRPTATESHSRIQLTGEARSPSLAEERKEKNRKMGKREQKVKYKLRCEMRAVS